MLKFEEVSRYLGDPYQLFGIKQYAFTDGKAAGVEAVDVRSGAGLEFTVLKSKCMDIAYASYKGTNLSFNAKPGIVNQSYFIENESAGFLRCFNAGMLTTGGLTHMGAACVDEGEALGLHGSIHNTACFETGAAVERCGDTRKVVLHGKVREAQVFAQNLVLERTITCGYGENKLTVCDSVTNEGFTPAPLMLLYHINFGFPMLCEETEVEIPYESMRPRDAEAQKGVANVVHCEAPAPGRPEQCYFYEVTKEKDGGTFYKVTNPVLGLSVKISYNADAMPCLTQWKSMACGDYALGLEPGTFWPTGRAQARAQGKLPYLAPGEVKHFGFTLEVTEL